jgi:hypothetical protein
MLYTLGLCRAAEIGVSKSNGNVQFRHAMARAAPRSIHNGIQSPEIALKFESEGVRSTMPRTAPDAKQSGDSTKRQCDSLI